MFSRFAQSTLRTARSAVRWLALVALLSTHSPPPKLTPRNCTPATRGYATAAGTKGNAAGLAPYFLGAGLAGSALFYYSTRDQRALKTESSSSAATKAPAALSPDEFRNLTISEIKPYNHNTSRFVFDLPEGTASGLTVASALVVKAANEGECLNDKGKPVIRPYTPVTAPNQEGKLELLIKHYPGGAFTEYLWKLKEGDAIAMKGASASGTRLRASLFQTCERPQRARLNVTCSSSHRTDPQAPVRCSPAASG
ncbi:hypothetical protein BMF94_4847 [Rhodotorula taiwanensis]|uniref:cytochrome-b5 reductase n=1 Tax=Rhodotorula taiwanensis TaxID=741276 RepID=A0A2S5B5V0_9BASI|nr:hypothetical protein BMF94_4847 [Rhodotorula taiwanensis]